MEKETTRCGNNDLAVILDPEVIFAVPREISIFVVAELCTLREKDELRDYKKA